MGTIDRRCATGDDLDAVDEVVGDAAEADPVRLRAVGDGTAPVDQDQRPVVAKRAQLDRGKPLALRVAAVAGRSEEHTSELQSLMRISYAVFCLKKQQIRTQITEMHKN